MITFLVLLLVALFFTSLKFLIDIHAMTLKICKNKELNLQKNNLEKDYQFIKGLY